MTKETSSGSTPFSIFYRYPRLRLGLSLMGGLGVLSSGLVVAQTDSSVNKGTAPTKTTPERAIAASPAAPAPDAKSKPAPEAVKAAPLREPAPYASTKPYVPKSESASYSSNKPSGPTLEPVPYSAKKPVAPVQAPEVLVPAQTVVQQKPALPAPNLSLPDSAAAAKPPQVIVNPATSPESPKSPYESTNTYIDRSDFSIGATTRYEGPPTVVLSERSTGCQTISQNGKLSSGVCNVAAVTQLPATKQTPDQQIASKPTLGQQTPNQQIASKLTLGQQTPNQQIASKLTLGLQTPNQQIASKPTPNPQSANSGLTPQEPQLNLNGVIRLPGPPVAAVQPSNLGFLKLGDNGSRPTPQTPYSEYSAAPTPALPGQYYSSAVPSTSPRGLDYYNLTTRPAARPNIGKTSFMFPLTIPSAISSLFGWRIHPISGDYRFHAGTDLGAPEGTPVIAAVSGQVATADFLGGYGLTVILMHEKGTQQSLYAHLSEIFVQPGQQVEQGNVIGRVGSTGNSTGPHLHFEWRHLTSDGWVAVDAGNHLEYALAQFIRALQIAQSSPQRGT